MTGRPDLLEGYTADTAASLTAARDAIHAYQAALAAYTTAEPDDLDRPLPDLSGSLHDAVDQLDELDRLPAAFAAALRHLDTTFDPAAQLPGGLVTAPHDDRLASLVSAYLASPDATPDQAQRIADALLRAESAEDLRRLLPPGLPPATVDAVLALLTADGWRGAVTQFGRVLGNGTLTLAETNRLDALQTRYPASSRVVIQATRSAETATHALRANQPFLPTFGVHPPPGALAAARAASTTLGVAGMAYNAYDATQDYQNRDYRGVGSNAAALAGSWLLMAMGGPVTMTAGAVLVVGSLIYESNREEIDQMIEATGDALGL